MFGSAAGFSVQLFNCGMLLDCPDQLLAITLNHSTDMCLALPSCSGDLAAFQVAVPCFLRLTELSSCASFNSTYKYVSLLLKQRAPVGFLHRSTQPRTESNRATPISNIHVSRVKVNKFGVLVRSTYTYHYRLASK